MSRLEAMLLGAPGDGEGGGDGERRDVFARRGMTVTSSSSSFSWSAMQCNGWTLAAAGPGGGDAAFVAT